MRFRLLVSLVSLALALCACQEAPPMVVLVVTATPGGASVTEDPAAPAQSVTEEVTEPVATLTPAASPTHDPRPTPTMGQVQIAEQPFERGRMFWVQPLGQIWVTVITDEGRGDWTIYEDTFEDGEPEFDPSIVPPDDELYQPERGFGKLWRENEELREAIGWAVTPDEFGYISRYEYHPGGTMNADGTYTMTPGYHILFSLYEEPFRFNESDQTWQLGRGDE